MEAERKQLGGSSWKMAENAVRDHTKYQEVTWWPHAPTRVKLLGGLMHQLG